ncbi:endonuclease/exonuclease/phosphatase family protein [Maribacter sp. CXY002]|uniref:endonuclease/exonuclease/phosphatase family protein n=1 Tax=Maribacter luteocoastalis TaxID=3407671 RepID=UPI003B673088
MKQTFILILMLFSISSSLLSQDISVMTYNIKYDNINDTLNNWNDRKKGMADLINYYTPEFLGTQEVLFNQLQYLDDELTAYNYIGVGRDDGKQKGEFSPVFYNSKNYELLHHETFWLSDTPNEISVGWDAALERICTYGLFQHKTTQKKLYVFNTHFDHIGKVAREKSAALIIKKINEINVGGLPVILMGDFNLTPDENPIHLIKQDMLDGQKISQKPFYGPTGTFNGFDPNSTLENRIDYIFAKNLVVKSYIHIDDRMENNKHISDHLPVLAILE